MKNENSEMSQVREAVELIVRECEKQDAKGYTSKHDDQHIGGELVMASACYAMNRPWMECPIEYPWPEFDNRSKHNEEDSLIIAGALIVKEIIRLRRLKDRKSLPF